MSSLSHDQSDTAFAIYSLVSLTDSSFKSLLQEVNEDLDGLQQAAQAPPAYLYQPSLQTVLSKHRELSRANLTTPNGLAYHPGTFIVVGDEEYQQAGVVLASIDYDGTQRSDSFRVPANGAAGRLVAIELGESSWEETKDEAEGDMNALAVSLGRSGLNQDESSGMGSAAKTKPKYCFAIYRLHEQVRMPGIAAALNGDDWITYQVNDHTFRMPPWMPAIRLVMGSDNLANIKDVHRRSTHNYPKFHPDLAIAADNPDFNNHGLLLVNFAGESGYETKNMMLDDLKSSITALSTGERSWNQL